MNMGNSYGFPIPFLNFSERDEASSSADVSYESSSSDSENEATMEFDAPFRNNQLNFQSDTGRFHFPDSKIVLETVKKIEMDLDFYEFISLIFLLYDGNHLALQVMRVTIEDWYLNGQESFTRDKISNWAYTKLNNWNIKLVEALAVIQNYQILIKLGYNKDEIDTRFHPTKDATLYLNRPKKMLYRVCECLTAEHAKKLVELVRSDTNFENDITMKCKPIYLEFYILFWISRGYITIDDKLNLKNVTKHLKVMDFLDLVEDVDNMVKSVNNDRREVPLVQNIKPDDSNIYPIINPLKVGLCIIVNMSKFVKNVEKRPQFKNLIPKKKLTDRYGTLSDVESLTNTLTKLNCKVVVTDNVFHDDLEHQIQSLVKGHFETNVHSVLVLCILSHGAEGIVYAANSVPVTIRDIQNTVSGPSPVEHILAGIPKVIIIQACQGDNPLLVEPELLEPDGSGTPGQLCVDGGNLCFDGPEKIFPRYSDVLVCMAIIEGYVAVRSVREGTKYIQELCRCLNEYYDKEHLLDIITRVHDKLNSEKMHVTHESGKKTCSEHEDCLCVYMTPVLSHSFRKKLFLVRKKR